MDGFLIYDELPTQLNSLNNRKIERSKCREVSNLNNSEKVTGNSTSDDDVETSDIFSLTDDVLSYQLMNLIDKFTIIIIINNKSSSSTTNHLEISCFTGYDYKQ